MGRGLGGDYYIIDLCWVLGMLPLHEVRIPGDAGKVIVGREEVKLVIWPSGCMTTLTVVTVGS